MHVSGATCLLCQPPEVIGASILDHLRLFHPDAQDVPARSPDAVPELPVIDPIDIEREVVCSGCDYLFRPGDRYTTRLLGMAGDAPVSEIICLGCEPAAGG